MTKRRLLAGVMFGLMMVLLMAVACGGMGSGAESGAGAIAEAKAEVAEAKAKKLAFDELKEEASQFGLYLVSSEKDEYNEIRDRIFANEELASALRAADDEGVTVFLERKFRVGKGYVEINVDATDQEIIEFLLGK